MTTTSDGCPVELYALLPAAGEPELIHAAVGCRPVSILELGCGTGRLLRPLAALGHQVAGVDDSAQMLEYLGELPGVHSTIESLALDRTFDVVLLASNLLNTPSDEQRAALLASASRHTRPGGQVLAQLHPAGWFDTVRPGRSRLGDIEFELHSVSRSRSGAGDLLSATVTYRTPDRIWHHPFTARRLAEPELAAEFAAAGLRFDRWIDDRRSWALAVLDGDCGCGGDPETSTQNNNENDDRDDEDHRNGRQNQGKG